MKKGLAFCFALLLLPMLLLGGCGQPPIEDYTGVWQYAGYQEDLDGLVMDDYKNLPAQLYFTADGYMYLLRSQPVTDIGVLTEVFSYSYRIEGGKLQFEPVEREGIDEAANVQYATVARYPQVEISPKKGGLEVKINDPSLTYQKKSTFLMERAQEPVPYGYTDADRREKQERVEGIYRDIGRCAQDFGRALGLEVAELGREGWPAGEIPYGVAYSAGGVQFVLTVAEAALPGFESWYVHSTQGWGASWPVVISGEFALVVPESADMAPGGTGVPAGWIEVFSGLYSP